MFKMSRFKSSGYIYDKKLIQLENKLISIISELKTDAELLHASILEGDGILGADFTLYQFPIKPITIDRILGLKELKEFRLQLYGVEYVSFYQQINLNTANTINNLMGLPISLPEYKGPFRSLNEIPPPKIEGSYLKRIKLRGKSELEGTDLTIKLGDFLGIPYIFQKVIELNKRRTFIDY